MEDSGCGAEVGAVSPSARYQQLAHKLGPPLSPDPDVCGAAEELCKQRASRLHASERKCKLQQITAKLRDARRESERIARRELAQILREQLAQEQEEENALQKLREDNIGRREALRAKREAQSLQKCRAQVQQLFGDGVLPAWRKCAKAWGGWPIQEDKASQQSNHIPKGASFRAQPKPLQSSKMYVSGPGKQRRTSFGEGVLSVAQTASVTLPGLQQANPPSPPASAPDWSPVSQRMHAVGPASPPAHNFNSTLASGSTWMCVSDGDVRVPPEIASQRP